jgi:hypothetical protein
MEVARYGDTHEPYERDLVSVRTGDWPHHDFAALDRGEVASAGRAKRLEE